MLPFEVQPIFFTDGLTLYQYLQAAIAAHYLPKCIVLDINMPVWEGIQCLEAIRKSPQYDHIPIVMFTTSASNRERQRCMDLGANAFFTKPASQAEYRQLAGELVILLY